MFTPEQTNFLVQCCKRRRFGDGARFLARPLRVSLYRLKQRATRPAPGAESTPVRREADGELDAMVHGVFAMRPPVEAELPADPRLLTEVDGQLRGVFRLAGGSTRQVDPKDVNSSAVQALVDAEDRHAWHRLYWAVRYAQAAAAGHETAVDALCGELSLWLDRFATHGTESTAPYTMSERICSLAEVLFWTSGLPVGLPDELTIRLKQHIRRDARDLFHRFEYHLGVHNHLLNNARGLYSASAVLPECAEAGTWRETAFQTWDRFFPALLLPDGTLAEESSHYHLLLCRTALEYYLASRRASRPLPDGMRAKLAGMFNLANELLRPDGTLPRFGDNSPDHVVEDLWGLMAAAHECGLLQQPPRHAATTLLTSYYVGSAKPASTQPSNRESCLYPQGGFAVLRDGAAELVAHGSPRSHAGVHGDSGLGSFELWREGHVIIREPGCYLGPSGSRSSWYRSAEAQNVTSVDELAPVILLDDQRRMPEWYWRTEGTWRRPNSMTLQFESNSFGRLRCGLKMQRTWTFNDAGDLVFEELLAGTGFIRLRSRLFLGDGAWDSTFQQTGNTWRLSGMSDVTSPVELALHLPAGLSPTVQQAHFTPEYGVERPAQVVVLAGRTCLPCRWTLRSEFGSAPNSRREI